MLPFDRLRVAAVSSTGFKQFPRVHSGMEPFYGRHQTERRILRHIGTRDIVSSLTDTQTGALCRVVDTETSAGSSRHLCHVAVDLCGNDARSAILYLFSILAIQEVGSAG